MRAGKNVCLTVALVLAAGVAVMALRADDAQGGQTMVVKMLDTNLFQPETITMTAGDTVEWINADKNSIHTATAKKYWARFPGIFQLPPGAKPFDSGTLTPGQKYKLRFTVPGTYKYFCIPHQPQMKGTIIVKPKPE